MSTANETPLEAVVKIFGNKSNVARLLDISHSSVSLWGSRTGGFIPVRHFPILQQAAKARGKTLSLKTLLYGK